MYSLPQNVATGFNEILQQRAVPELFHPHYRKWLRYFLDFCRKYSPPDAKSEQIRLFIEKLRSKKQTPQQCRQAAHAISLLLHLEYPFDIVIKLLYGCGLRLFECLSLRVQNFNFEAGILTVHGKGDKDRSVPLPQVLLPLLKAQLEFVSELHEKDRAAGYAGVFLVDALERKYPTAAKDFIWQWFFPQQGLTLVPGTNERRRYHLHESQVQRVLKNAVRQAKLTKRVRSHTFRHYAESRTMPSILTESSVFIGKPWGRP